MAPASEKSLLKTKLHSPRLHEGRVARPCLLESLRQYGDRCLILLSAPAGYGKSTLIAEWTADDERPAVWCCLDESDNELREFLRYLVAAVRSAFPEACGGTTALLQAAELPSVRVLAALLANELDVIGSPLTLVLDDYHMIHESAIHDLMTELLRHPPVWVHWVINTRRDPPLPLASLRASGQMHEIRFDDLRFTASEAGVLLERILGQPLSGRAISKVEEVTEGWVAGLQLVALACRRQADFEAFLMGLQGNIREIKDYLIAEVLSHETPEFRRCILKTSVVDRFSAAFCEGVCGNCEECPLAGDGMMEKLADTGAFIIPLDAHGEWFRYHPLFRDLLKWQLDAELKPGEIADLHSRASRWFAELGLIEFAIDHALAAEDALGAAVIVENHLHTEMNADRWQIVERWLGKIPVEVQQERPHLLLGAACVAIERSEVHELPALVERIEVLIDEATAEPEVLGALNLLRGEIKYWQGEPQPAHELYVQARGQIPSSLHFFAGENELHAALALQALGRYDEARSELAASTSGAETSAPVYLSRLVAGQVFVDTLAGNLAAAAEGAHRLESLGRKYGNGYVELWGIYMQVLTNFHWLEVDAVAQRCSELTEKVYLLHSRAAVDTLAIFALCSSAGGQSAASESAVHKLREFAEESGNLELRNVAGSCEARLAVRRGDFESAVRWQRSLRESPDFPSMLFWVENPLITECRILTARGSKADLRLAEEKLTVLQEGFANLHNICQLIEVGGLAALTLEKQGRSSQALDALKEVVAMAEPGGWILPFVELGDPMEEMLERIEPPEDTAGFVAQLRAGFGEGGGGGVRTKDAAEERPDIEQPLIEPLTNRELDVLELIGKRLYDKEIADQLSISPGTVKTHLKHIYQKLDVGKRRAAVDRAKALGILGKSR